MRQVSSQVIAALILTFSLGACNKSVPTLAATDCLDLPVYPPASVDDPKQSVQACVERNAALYAKGPDTPDALSKAVIAKCPPVIIHFVEVAARAAGEKPQFMEALEAWRQQTLPVIAEARARGCYS